jgi:hypothetical protein
MPRIGFSLLLVGGVASTALAGFPSAIDASKFAGPQVGTTIVLISADDSSSSVERRITTLAQPSQGVFRIRETYSEKSSGRVLESATYVLDASPHLLSRRNQSGSNRIILISAKTGEQAATWSATMHFSSDQANASPGLTKNLGGVCQVAAVAKVLVAEQTREVLTVRCEHRAANGERISRFTNYAEKLGEVGSAIELRGPNDEVQGGVKWNLLRVERTTPNE